MCRDQRPRYNSLHFTPLDQIPALHAKARDSFKTGVTRPLAYRRQQLLQLAHLVQDNADAFSTALYADLNKQKFELVTSELAPLVKGALHAAESLENWAAPELPKVEDFKASWNATIYKAPKGVALIISPWNYPLILTLQPLIGAIAAGCPAVCKPSEVSSHCSQLLADLFPKYLDPNSYMIVNGAVKETTALLDLPWDHIFYTGNGRVGRIVATAAAKHLTPITLELGGQSPVIIDDTADLKLAAKRILWAKSQNAGQLCVSPNHIFVPRAKQEALVEAIKHVYKEFWPKEPLDPESTFGRVISPPHFHRVQGYLNATKGQVAIGGKTEGERGLETTIVKDVSFDDSMMSEELFGPLLPIVPIDDMDDAIKWINEHDNPLALYVFTEDNAFKEKVLNTTSSGSIIFNDCVSQLAAHELPFGGHGASGYGFQHSRWTFETFTHLRSSIDVPASSEPGLSLRYAPYSDDNTKIMGAALTMRIPS